jgi:hypothetical protein
VFRKLKAFFNPEQFQGWGKKRSYFEGWYFKLVDPSERHAFAVIPGLAYDKDGKGHAFIQVLDGKALRSNYHRFHLNDFRATPGKFELTIGDNYFSESRIQIQLPAFTGSVSFESNVAWPKPFYSPGIMGPYAFAPFMECYHGIVSMDHHLGGDLVCNGNEIDFSGGRGYIEKDWGRSFPSAYIWFQTNHFTNPGISIKASVAKIPWLRSSFVGFIAGVWLKDRLIRFTTYNRSKLHKSYVDQHQVHLVLENPDFHLDLLIERKDASILISPILGAMKGRIEESMTSIVQVTLTKTQSGEILLKDHGRNAGLEVAGEIDEIMI